MLTRREWIAAGGAGVVSGQSQRPNVVLLMTDQQTIAALSAAGNPHVRTPNLDRLAREGMRFENSWCASPVCGPSRSSLLTGCYPTTSGVEYNGQSMRAESPTVGELFRNAGYETAWAGKWHLPAAYPGIRIPGRDSKQPMSARGFDFLPFSVERAPLMAFGDFTDEPIARAAADFLKRDRDKPFFLGVSLHNPHDICYWVMDQLAPEHPSRAEFDVPESKLPPLPPNHRIAPDEPEFIAMCRRRKVYGPENTYTTNWDDIRWRRYLYGYYRMTERVDKACGLVIDALRDSGRERDTILIFTSDHGEGMSAHSWVVKLMLWQEVVSVPLLWRWPGRIAAGKVNRSAMANGVDLLPTLCDLTGIEAPRTVHGQSLAPVLMGKAQAARSSVFAQLAPDTADRTMQGRAVRSARYKYVRFSKGANPEMFFDLQHDPGEIRNLAGDKESARELGRHRDLMQDWLGRTGDSFRLS